MDNANCISIVGDDPIIVGWQRSAMGMYFYNIFENKITKSQKVEYDYDCYYIPYDDHIILQYGGGAIGRQCFLEEELN